MRALLIAALMILLLCAWQTSFIMQASAATTSPTERLDLAAEVEPEEEGQEGDDQAGSSFEAEVAAAEEEEEEEDDDDERDEQAGGAERSRSGHGKSSHATHGAHFAVVSRLELTAKAKTALRQEITLTSSLSFSFTLSASTKLEVTLVRQAAGHGQTGWRQLPDSLVLKARQGHTVASLAGHNRLTPGRYRLTITPAGGQASSIYLTARP
ncbi:MAG TPA: hypothetical protein VFR48_06850 [Solirubrobacteraceae bacterium]|nr:hypothetical protein [Solirubrobacteraceae bacterium]